MKDKDQNDTFLDQIIADTVQSDTKTRTVDSMLIWQQVVNSFENDEIISELQEKRPTVWKDIQRLLIDRRLIKDPRLSEEKTKEITINTSSSMSSSSTGSPPSDTSKKTETTVDLTQVDEDQDPPTFTFDDD